jgi:hypothetical protein
MFLILAIEPDRRQAARLGAIARGPLRNAELLTVDTVEAALALLARRVPDLVLTSMLLSAKDDAALAERLRELDTSGRQVQTLVIPMFAAPRKSSEGGLLARFTRSDDEGPSHGCQPAVFAAQLNEYLDDLQLDREAREMRQPYSAPAETLYHQPTVSNPYHEVVASVPAEQVIVPEPALIVPEPPMPEPPAVPAREAAAPSILKEPTRSVEPPHVELPYVVAAAEIAEPLQAVDEPLMIEPPRAVEPAPVEDAPTAEPTRLIAPSPIVEPRHSVVKPARTESIVNPAGDRHAEKVAEPPRSIAPAPETELTHETPPAAAHAVEPRSPRPLPRPIAPVSRPPAAASKVKPKVAKVQFVPPPLHEDPEVAKFMAALNDLPMADAIEAAAESEKEAATLAETVAASTVELHGDLNGAATPEPQVVEHEPRETVAAPKTVKALKPARARTISPAAAPPSPPPTARKRVTPIRRGASASTPAPEPTPPDPAPEGPPGLASRPAAPAPTPRPAAAANPRPAPAASPRPAPAPSAPVKVVGRIQPAAATPAAPAGARAGKQKGSSRRPRPVQDEWGLFDPDQAGLPAVQAALEDIEEPDIFRNVSTPPKSRS